jgi:hypothetical protein
VTALYVLGEARNPLPLRREDAFLWYSTAISLGNLIWPLFLQLAIISSNWKWRLFFLCLVSLIVAFSPFRGVFFAVGVFGVLLPLLEHVIAQIKAYPRSSGKTTGLKRITSGMARGIACIRSFSRKSGSRDNGLGVFQL